MTTLWEIDCWSLLYWRTTIMILKHVYTVIVTLPVWRQRRIKFKGERFRPCLGVRQPVLQSHNAILADGDHVFRHAWMNQWSGVHLGYCSKHQRVCSIGYLPNKQLGDVGDWRIQPRSQGPLKLGSSGLRGPSRRGPWERGWFVVWTHYSVLISSILDHFCPFVFLLSLWWVIYLVSKKEQFCGFLRLKGNFVLRQNTLHTAAEPAVHAAVKN